MALGAIGDLSGKQVKARLMQLDKALQPFQDRLSIVKATFDSIQEPAQAALNAIDRQMETALKALESGQASAADTVKALDAQRQAIEDYVAAQQQSVDNAQIQLTLASAQQAQERALLAIQQKRVKATKAVTEAAGSPFKESKAAQPKEEKIEIGRSPRPRRHPKRVRP